MVNDTAWSGPLLKTRSKELRSGREFALKAMYSVDVGNVAPPIAWLRCQRSFFAETAPPTSPRDVSMLFLLSDEALETALDIARHFLHALSLEQTDIDAVIRRSSKRWRISRMQPIERNILRIGTFELIKGLVPARDVIYDCVELAKTYGDAPTPDFVNGILDQICQDNQIVL